MNDEIEAKLVEYQRASRVVEQAEDKVRVLSGLLQDARDVLMNAREELGAAEHALLKSAWS